MKALLDFIPVLAFFVAYIFFGQDIYLAVKVIMVATVIQLLILYAKDRALSKMHLISGALLIGFGALTLVLQNDLFIKWKPTVVNWLFAAAFGLSLVIGKQPLIQRIAGESVPIADEAWRKLTYAYVAFFTFLGVLNLIVVYNTSEATWVKFKLFGLMGLTFVFMIGQAFWIMRQVPETEQESE